MRISYACGNIVERWLRL